MVSDKPVRIAIVNDYEVVVAGLAAMLEPFRDRIEVVELDVRTGVRSDVDLALYDTFAQDGDGRVDCEAVCRNHSARWLVVYSWSATPPAVAEALEQGARGYLPKGISAEELVAALERVDGGETVVLAGSGVDAEVAVGDWPGRREGLSEREAEVLALIAQGLSNDQVASRAMLSINTVKSYIRSGYRKMGVQSRSQAVLWALDHGFSSARSRTRLEPDAL